MKGKVSIKTVIVLVILVLVGVLGVLGVNTVRTYMSGASAGAEPKNVLATSSEDGRSSVITWQTDKATQGVVEYGTTPASLLLRGIETDEVTDHKVTLTPLKANTSYYFRIRVGEEVYDNSGIPFSYKTKSSGTDTVVTTVSPTTVPVAAAPVASGSAANSVCNRNTDYNNDGSINTVDFITCMKSGGKPATPSATTKLVPTTMPGASGSTVSASSCNHTTDYDGNGIINSIDWIKCLQSKK